MVKNKMLSIEEVEKKLILHRLKKLQTKLQNTLEIAERFKIIGEMQKLFSILEELEQNGDNKQTA